MAVLPRAGVAREILWETNERPKVGEVLHTWTPDHGWDALADIEPLVHLLGLHAKHYPELWTRVHAVEETLRGPDDPSTLAGMQTFLRMTDAHSRLGEIANQHSAADVVVTVQILRADAEGANFWIHSHGRDGPGCSRRHEGTWEDLKHKGFDYEIEGDGPNPKITLNFDRYIANMPIPHEIIEGSDETPTVDPGDHSPCFFLPRLT